MHHFRLASFFFNRLEQFLLKLFSFFQLSPLLIIQLLWRGLVIRVETFETKLGVCTVNLGSLFILELIIEDVL